MKTYFQAILDSFQIIEMSNKNTWIYSIMLHIAHLKQPRYLLNHSQDFGIPGYLVVFTVIECGREILVALEGEGIGIILLLVLLLKALA